MITKYIYQNTLKIGLKEEEKQAEILTVLEHIILHDPDRTIRNLASNFYSKIKTETEKEVSNN